MLHSFYAVHAGFYVIGDIFDDKWETTSMKQIDPVEDFDKNVEMIFNAAAAAMFVHHNIIKLYPERFFEHV